jgi:hypothetical protein
LKGCEAIYEELAGWNENITGIGSYDRLPALCRAYVEWNVHGRPPMDITPSLRASALSALCTSPLPPLHLKGMGSTAIVDPRATVPVAIPRTLGSLINVAVRHPSLRAAGLMMTVPLPTGDQGAAHSVRRAEAQGVIRAHPRTPP